MRQEKRRMNSQQKLNVSVKARKERTYLSLEVRDKVKITRKKDITGKEEQATGLPVNI